MVCNCRVTHYNKLKIFQKFDFSIPYMSPPSYAHAGGLLCSVFCLPARRCKLLDKKKSIEKNFVMLKGHMGHSQGKARNIGRWAQLVAIGTETWEF